MNEKEISEAQELIDSVAKGTGELTPAKAVFPTGEGPEARKRLERAKHWRRLRGINDGEMRSGLYIDELLADYEARRARPGPRTRSSTFKLETPSAPTEKPEVLMPQDKPRTRFAVKALIASMMIIGIALIFTDDTNPHWFYLGWLGLFLIVCSIFVGQEFL